MKIIPNDSYLAIRPDRSKDKTLGGIALPDSAIMVKNVGEVVAVGAGDEKADGSRYEMLFEEGDRVVFDLNATHTMADPTGGDDDLFLMHMRHVLAKIED